MKFTDLQKLALKKTEDIKDIKTPRILVGAGTCGRAAGAVDVIESLRATLKRESIHASIVEVGCLGLCYVEVLVEVDSPDGLKILYSSVTPDLIPEIIESQLISSRVNSELALATMGEKKLSGIPAFTEIPMLKGQVRVVLRNCGVIDPENIYHYIATGGYTGLAKALSITPEDVIAEIKNSGLRGRGGAGFPTGLKWELCHRSKSSEKYMICNADEGDPGAFMDRSVLEGDPHSVLEGMVIAAYAIGANQGYIYVRAEYPLAIERLRIAIQQMHENDLLGEDILDSGFNFDVKIKQGAGAFVCGEETALMASIEGKRGMPRPRPPFPAQSGLFGKPTTINNVESLANVPVIMAKGSRWFSQFGTEKSKGTKTFALAGKIKRTGLIEVPMGITLRKIVYDIGGGILDNKIFKAVQTGGPSGGCLPIELLDLPVEYETLAQAGSIMGSGGMIILDEDTCMVDLAKYFLEFTKNESCGKCVPCRIGTHQLLNILTDITEGRGKMEDVNLLIELGQSVKQGSLCGLGQSAPNPVLTTLRYFEDEYDAHVRKKKCLAVVCKKIVIAPCRHTCPAGIDVSRYVRCISEGRFDEALDVIRENNPLPTICGRVCFHPCETKCRRGQIDDPIAIRALKRLVAERADRKKPAFNIESKKTSKKVAIVGSGPAGLTAGYYLVRLGHEVTIFEALPVAGGMLRTAIPEFRLPRYIVDMDIRDIESVGVTIKTNTPIRSVMELKTQGYDAVFLALGAQEGIKGDIPGSDDPMVFDCLDLLRRLNQGDKSIEPGKKIVIVGGGNAAIDAARTSIRMGADDVLIIYRRTRLEMTASEEEIQEALAEGAHIEFLVSPLGIKRQDSKLVLECVRMKLGPVDRSGRPSPQPISGSEFKITADSVIMSIGQAVKLPEEMEVEVDSHNRIVVDKYTLETSLKGVFAGGDVVTGPNSIVEAIGAGKQAAISIDRYLGGDGDILRGLGVPEIPTPKQVEVSESEQPRVDLPMRPAKSRINDWEEVEIGYDEEMAMKEANRCLRCDMEELE